MRSRLAAYSRWSKECPYGPDSTPAKARAGLEQRFLREGDLPEPERRRRAECARRAHYQRLALASARARRLRKTSRSAPSTSDTGVSGGRQVAELTDGGDR